MFSIVYKIKDFLLGNKFAKETAWSFFSKGIIFVFYILLNIILARFLGREAFGSFSFFFSIFNIVVLISYFGINNSTRKFVAQHNKTEVLSDVLQTSLTIRVVISLLMSAVLSVVSPFLAKAVGRPEFTVMFIASVPLLFLLSFDDYLNGVFQGLHRLKYNFYIGTLEAGLRVLFVIGFIGLFGLVGVIYSYTLALTLSSIVGAVLLYKHFYSNSKRIFSLPIAKQIIRYSLPLFFLSIGFMLSSEVDTILVAMLRGDGEAGIFAVAKQLVVKLPQVALAISLGVMPVFAKKELDREQSKKILHRLLRINTAIFVPLSLFVLSTAWFLVPLLYGDEYRSAVLPLLLLLPNLLTTSYSVFINAFLDYRGKAKARAVNLSLCLLANIVLDLLLIPQYGAAGAALATSLSYLPYALLNWKEVRKELV
jgi:O-antigen/teichoic acid export membrane protein